MQKSIKIESNINQKWIDMADIEEAWRPMPPTGMKEPKGGMGEQGRNDRIGGLCLAKVYTKSIQMEVVSRMRFWIVLDP